MTSFVYDGDEVKLTGREATRQIPQASNRTRTLTLVEVTPVDNSFDWKKWVDPNQLYTIEDKNNG